MEVGPGPTSVKVAGLSVAGSIAALKVALIAALGGTEMAPLPGVSEVTVGAVPIGPEPVVKVQVNVAASGFPARSSAPTVILAVNVTPALRALFGVKVAVAPTAE